MVKIMMMIMTMMIMDFDNDGSDDKDDKGDVNDNKRNMYRTPSATYLVLVVHNVRYPELRPPTLLLQQLNRHRLYVN